MAVQGPQKLSWSRGVEHLLSCFSFKCLFSFSLPRPLSPPAAGPHLPMALSGDRKLDTDPYTPCTQDCKQIPAQRKRRQSGWEEEARHGRRPRQGKKKRAMEVEPQGEEDEKRETRDLQRPRAT